MQHVYFDNAATTQIRDEVIFAMAEVMKTQYGNPSSSHSFGRSAKALIEKSRKTIASYLNAVSYTHLDVYKRQIYRITKTIPSKNDEEDNQENTN